MTKPEPTPEQFTEWLDAALLKFDWRTDSAMVANQIASYAYEAGADTELAACCEAVSHWYGDWHKGIHLPTLLWEARRPKKPSLKEQAIQELNDAVLRGDCITISSALTTIRKALNSLPDS